MSQSSKLEQLKALFEEFKAYPSYSEDSLTNVVKLEALVQEIKALAFEIYKEENNDNCLAVFGRCLACDLAFDTVLRFKTKKARAKRAETLWATLANGEHVGFALVTETLEAVFADSVEETNKATAEETIEEAEEILTVSDLFKAISEQYEAGVTSESDHYWDGYSCLDPIETDEVKDRLHDIVAMLKYLHSETLGSSQISNREVCIENLTAGEFDEIICRGFGDEFAQVLEQAESECEEYEVVGRITQDNLDDFEQWCSKVDNLVYERVDFPNHWNIVNCIQANTESVYNFDFVERFSSAVAYENFYPEGFLCDYLEAAKDCLEEYAYELETYLNLAIQMTLEWEKSQKENKETACNE